MCGIVGYVGPRDATPIILDGLRRLEYRGYDSAGLAVVQPDGSIGVRRQAGKLALLFDRVDAEPLAGQTGIGHTRWATHGEPSERNAHPHLGPDGEIALVHNGIIENFRALQEELGAEGRTFSSEDATALACDAEGAKTQSMEQIRPARERSSQEGGRSRAENPSLAQRPGGSLKHSLAA